MARSRSEYIFESSKRRRGPLGCFLLGLLLLLSVVLMIALTSDATNRRAVLTQEKVSVMGLDKAFEGFSVLHLSDLHASAVGSDAQLWKDLFYGRSFQAAVLSGDMVGKSGDAGPFLSLIAALREAQPNAVIYFIAGDEDPAPVISTPQGTAEVLADWVRSAQALGAIYLDAPVVQQVGKRRVWFTPEYLYSVDASAMIGSLSQQKQDMEAAGKPYESEGGAAYRSLCYRLDAMQRTADAERDMLSSDLQIAVTHVPLTADDVRTGLDWADRDAVFNFRSVSLLLGGHYCGGQWCLPGGKPVYVPQLGWLPDSASVKGLQRISSINQYVSPGLGACGVSPFPGRLFNEPTATLLKFTATLN